MLSAKLWDVMATVALTLYHFLIWETRVYFSENVSTKTEMEHLIDYIAAHYWICTGSRFNYNDLLIPTGMILGAGWNCAFVEVETPTCRVASTAAAATEPHIKIHLLGWWTIRHLLQERLLQNKRAKGAYEILAPLSSATGYMKTTDDYDADHFHPNCETAAHIIQTSLNATPRYSGVFFLHGAPGLGKTTTARYLAANGGILCLDFEELCKSRYNTPVYELQQILNYVQPTRQYPLWIVLDDVDEYLFRKSNRDGKDYDDTDGCITDDDDAAVTFLHKSSKKHWCRLLDTIHQKQNVVLFLTSNRTKIWFDNIDTALLRPYRVSTCLHYTSQTVLKDRLDDGLTTA